MRLTARRDLTMTFSPDGRICYRSVGAGIEGTGPAEAALVLAFCSEPRSRAELVQRFGAMGGAAFDSMKSGGLLVPIDLADDTELFFDSFTSLDMHRRMLCDQPRVDGYAAAIKAAIEPGMVVLDAGTGTGLLACIAAAAGAKHVYAVDRSSLSLAKAVVNASGFSDRISLIQGDLKDIKLPEDVDLVITETFGALALSEGGMPDVTACCEKNLSPNGIVLPSAFSLMFAPIVDLAELAESPDIFKLTHGANLSPLRAEAFRRGVVVDIPLSALGGAPQTLVTAPYPGPPHASGSVRFPHIDGIRLVGWAGWFDLHLTDDHILSTGPSAPQTHWRQSLLAIEPWVVDPGSPIDLSVSITPAKGDRRGLEIATQWQQGPNSGSAFHRMV